jgi:hypothetical protein
MKNSNPFTNDEDHEDDDGEDEPDSSVEYVSASNGAGGNERSRVKNLLQHQWGWSLHCLYVSVNSRELSPLDKWLLEEEKRILKVESVPGNDAGAGAGADPANSTPFTTATTAAGHEHEHGREHGADRSLILAPPIAVPMKRISGEATTTFIARDNTHSDPDFDEPYFFKDVCTSTAETRDQSSLEDIAMDRDMVDKLTFASSDCKILIDNLPPMTTEQELSAAFERAGGRVEFMQIFHPERFEAAQPCNATLHNKKMKKKTQMKQIIHSDAYAFVAFDSKEVFDTLTKGDIRLFGICMKGFRCQVRPAENYDTFYIETLARKPTKYWIDIISSILGHDHEALYGSAYSAISPAFIQLKFPSHEIAWKAYLLLELALTDDVHYFQLNWRKCTWYYDLHTRSREKRRNNKKYLNAIADKIHADLAAESASNLGSSSSATS